MCWEVEVAAEVDSSSLRSAVSDLAEHFLIRIDMQSESAITYRPSSLTIETSLVRLCEMPRSLYRLQQLRSTESQIARIFLLTIDF